MARGVGPVAFERDLLNTNDLEKLTDCKDNPWVSVLYTDVVYDSKRNLLVACNCHGDKEKLQAARRKEEKTESKVEKIDTKFQSSEKPVSTAHFLVIAKVPEVALAGKDAEQSTEQSTEKSTEKNIGKTTEPEWKPDRIFMGIDASGSMADAPLGGMANLKGSFSGFSPTTFKPMQTDTRSKLEQLKDVIATFVSALDDTDKCQGRAFGILGDPEKKPCEQTAQLFGECPLSREQIVERVRALKPDGPTTPVALAINQCRLDAHEKHAERPLLVLFTDGCENCGGDVCKEIETFATDFPNGQIVVFGLDPSVKAQFDCVDNKAIAGKFKYVDATIPMKALEVLGKFTGHEVHGTLVDKGVKGKILQPGGQEDVNGSLIQKDADGNPYMRDVHGELLKKAP